MNLIAIFGVIVLAYAFYVVGMHFTEVKQILFIPVLMILGGWTSYYYRYHNPEVTQMYTYLAVALWVIGALWCMLYLARKR